MQMKKEKKKDTEEEEECEGGAWRKRRKRTGRGRGEGGGGVVGEGVVGRDLGEMGRRRSPHVAFLHSTFLFRRWASSQLQFRVKFWIIF